MVIINTINKAIRFLSEGYLFAKVTYDHPDMTNEYQVAGTLTGLTKEDWWYVVIQPGTELVCGVLEKTLFVDLYKSFYIECNNRSHNRNKYFALNDLCPIEDFPRYRRQVDCWYERTSKPAGRQNNTPIKAESLETKIPR